MNGDDLIRFEEEHPELRDKFLEKYGIDPSTTGKIIDNLLKTPEYADFLMEEMQ